ncbi:MAG: hypothetical protein IBJ11_08815 [Phycisphaerales bacterium]|nr:hypothetical protein [Phycisphaerales bacterium]
MKKTLSILGMLAVAGTASANSFTGDVAGGDLTLKAVYQIGTPIRPSGQRATPGAFYSNVDNFTGSGVTNGGAAGTTAAAITTLVADDIAATSAFSMTGFTFSVANFGTANISARARVRFYAADGTAGAPGTLIGGFTFNALSFPVGVNLLSATVGALAMPANFWAGITFDAGGTGTPTATAAQLNQLGQGTFNPPVVGSSADLGFGTTSAGSFLVNNPVGSTFNFSGNPVVNLGWEFIPTPGTGALFGLAGLVGLRRRRSA